MICLLFFRFPVFNICFVVTPAKKDKDFPEISNASGVIVAFISALPAGPPGKLFHWLGVIVIPNVITLTSTFVLSHSKVMAFVNLRI